MAVLYKNLTDPFYQERTPVTKRKNLETEIYSVEDSLELGNTFQKLHKPPKHPGQKAHLPQTKSPHSEEIKPRFSIFRSPYSNSSIETSIGSIRSTLTPNKEYYREKKYYSSDKIKNDYSTDSNDENSKTDIEKIINEQNYFKFQKKSRLYLQNKGISQEFRDKIIAKTERKSSNNNETLKHKKLNEEKNENKNEITLPPINLHNKNIIRKLIVPDIPKAAFGIHNPYNELKIENDFKIVQVEEKPRAPKFRSRSDTLEKDQQLREKILQEILSEHKKNCV